MNLDTAIWTRLLAEAMTVPGTPAGAADLDDAPHGSIVLDEWGTSEWSPSQAFERLGVALIDMPLGYILKGCGAIAAKDAADNPVIGLSPIFRPRPGLIAHELGHVILRHTNVPNGAGEDGETRAPIFEVEAEGVALLVNFALGEPAAVLAASRSYIQSYRDRPCCAQLPTSWHRITDTAARILSAGAGSFTVRRRPAPSAPAPASVYEPDNGLRPQPLKSFSSRIRWTR